MSADAFAVAVGKGLAMRRFDLRGATTIAGAFGLAQALMPLVGWLLGSELEGHVSGVDHWIAFTLLALVGGAMVQEAVTGGPDEETEGAGGGTAVLIRTGVRELLVLSVATSIDALAVGVSIAFLDVSIVAAALLIGATTAVLSLAGVVLGHRAGARWRRPAEVLGGLVLIGIGVQIVVEHTGAA